MSMILLYSFVLIMWILILVGGGLVVTLLGPISISGYGEWDFILSSGIKAIVAILLVVIWIIILSRIKNWIFTKSRS